MATATVPTIGPRQRTPEWHNLRADASDPRFGATAAAALLGVSKWKTPRHIYEEIVCPPDEPQDNAAMRVGRLFEPAIQRLYAEEHQRAVVTDIPTLLHPTEPLYASLDSVSHLAESEETAGTVAADVVSQLDGSPPWWLLGATDLEIKWSMSPGVASELGDEGSDWVPSEWHCQVQQQMDVAGLETAEIAVFLYGRLRVYRVDRNDGLIAAIHDAAREMRERIINRDPPEPTWEHARTPELVRQMRADGVAAVEATDDMAAYWKRRKVLAESIKLLNEERDELTARFEYELLQAGATAAILPGGEKKVVRREITRKGYEVGPKTYTELREVKHK